jgi:hypothetical protein
LKEKRWKVKSWFCHCLDTGTRRALLENVIIVLLALKERTFWTKSGTISFSKRALLVSFTCLIAFRLLIEKGQDQSLWARYLVFPFSSMHTCTLKIEAVDPFRKVHCVKPRTYIYIIILVKTLYFIYLFIHSLISPWNCYNPCSPVCQREI